MTKSITREQVRLKQAILDGLLLSIPTVLTFIGIGNLFLSRDVFWHINLISTLLLLFMGAYLQIKQIDNQNFTYRKQLETKIFSNHDHRGFGEGFLAFFFYITNIFGTMFVFFRYIIMSKNLNTFLELHNIIGVTIGVLVVITFISSVMFVITYSANIICRNYGGSKLLHIPLSDFELIGFGSKKMRFTLEVMIYGDENSPENITLINEVVAFNAMKYREIIHAERENFENSLKNDIKKVEEEFLNDKFKSLKEKLTALKI